MKRLALVALTLGLACGPHTPPAQTPVPSADPVGEKTEIAAVSETETVLPEPATVTEPEPPPPPPPPEPKRFVITVVSASVDGKMPDGREWDDEPAYKAPDLTGPLAEYIAGNPVCQDAAAYVGEPLLAPQVTREARSSPAADPMVFVKVRAGVFRSPLIPRAYHPLWNFSFTVTTLEDTDEMAQITVVDWDGPSQVDVIGTTMVPLKDVLSGKLTKIKRFGSVKELVLRAAPAPALEKEKRLVVPGKPTWTDTGIDVLAGQSVSIRASGQICTWGKKNCDYPDGQTRVYENNLPAFEKQNHGALIGFIGDVRFVVGRERDFVAPASGRLYLGNNDDNDQNNTGSFDVFIRIE